MRIAVISDIHGKCLALDAVLADLQQHPADQIVCLGDAIQGGHQPAETVQRLRELACPIIMGNADAWLLTGIETGKEGTSEQQLAMREWSLARLSEADRQFIAGFHPTYEIALEGGHKLLCFHGSPHSFDDIIYPDTPEEQFQQFLGAFAPAIMTGGHTHTQQVRRLGETFFFNPGSVGVAYNRHQPDEGFQCDPWAEYAVLTSEGARLGLEFRRVPLDAQELIQSILASGRPNAKETVAQYQGRGQG
ncbi:MAG TPA: metallophosphoesterase family protein [Ktedonobacterales bacterium]|jgi:putative phosphoesterase